MSSRLLSRSADLQRLQAEGFDVEIRSGHLLLNDIPYVKADRSVGRGILVSTLSLAGDRTQPPDSHVAFWIGDFPCDVTGNRMDFLGSPDAAHDVDGAMKAQHTFSRRAEPPYVDYHQKMTTYVSMIESQAQRLDSTQTARVRRPARPEPDDSVFEYLETSSARSGIGPINSKLALTRVAIVGVGGTGSYVLDLLAKTPIKELHLFDGDLFLTHNAFRSPGAPTLADLEQSPKKVNWFKELYSKMRRGIVAHDYGLDHSNASELLEMSYVFLCMDAGPEKKEVLDFIIAKAVPFIDVGVGLVSSGESLTGSARITRVTKSKSDHASRRIPLGEPGPDVYDQNIQVADMNALNAALAVVRWKKECGFYADFGKEHSAVYSISTNSLTNDEVPDDGSSPPT